MTITKNEFSDIYKKGLDPVWIAFDKLQEIIKEQERQLKLNSSNSSKPPSTDINKKNNSRIKSGRKSGGQIGHPGKTLYAITEPNEIIPYCPKTCSCGYEFGINDAIIKKEKRQIVDIQKPKIKIIEHQVAVLECPCCKTEVKGTFPKNVTAPVQYGDNLKSYIVYLMVYQLLPYKRTTDLLKNLHGISISEGTLNNILKDFAKRIDIPIEVIKQYIIDSEVVHFDESGLYVEGKRDWFHVASTTLYTYYFHHKTRGFEATESAGILNKFQGTACHDYWTTYYKYECRHSLCNAHHMRNLQGIFDSTNFQWSLDMKSFFSAAKKIVDAAKACGKTELDTQLLKEIEKQYQKIIDAGYKVVPAPPPRKKGQCGPTKKGKAYNLLERLDQKRDEILDFIYDFSKPFDNNQAERDIRMIKVKQKISGTFRNPAMADVFCKIRSFISTAIKHSVNVYDAIINMYNDDVFLPDLNMPK